MHKVSNIDDLREAVTTLKDMASTARRVLGCANPLTTQFEDSLRYAQRALWTRKTPPPVSA
jgi:hypothetical protein